MKIYFIIFEKVEELDLVGSWQLIGLLAEKGLCEPPRLISLNSMTPKGEHGMRFIADKHFLESDVPDIIIVPGGSGAKIAMEDTRVISFLKAINKKCAATLCICTGMYLLQQAGILKNRKATTHWEFMEDLRMDPSVDVVEERFVKDGKLWTSAGVSAGMDMTLAFIADYFGEKIASEIQLEAEYFPSTKIYGDASDRQGVSKYITKLVESQKTQAVIN